MGWLRFNCPAVITCQHNNLSVAVIKEKDVVFKENMPVSVSVCQGGTREPFTIGPC